MSEDMFDSCTVSTDARVFLKELEARLAELPAAHEVPVEVSRKARDEGVGIFPYHPPEDCAEEIDIPGAPGGPGRVRIIRPDGPVSGVFLHIHGGGWTLGRPWHQDYRMKALSEDLNCATVSVEYRLAPENKWPACAEDCLAAARWLLENAEEQFGTDRVAIGGESAGAHLAASTLLALKEEGQVDRIAGALMVYGVYDMGLTPSVRNWGERKLILSTPTVKWFADNLGIAHRDLRQPRVSPLFGDLSGMPPALFQCGTEDPLVDDTAFMAARWAQAGARAETIWYPGGVHAFDYFDTPLGRAARRDGSEFLFRVFEGGSDAA